MIRSDRVESGSITVFVVVICSALFLLAGLVYDGGSIIAAKQRAVAAADGAARAGAQKIDVDEYRRTGQIRFDVGAAQAAGNAYLQDTEINGSVSVENGAVVARTNITQPMAFLGIVGIGSKQVTGEGRSHALQGIREPSK